MSTSCSRPQGCVTIGHAPIESQPWPTGWENIRGAFHAHLKARIRSRATRNPIFNEARGIAERLGVPPAQVSDSTWEALERALLVKKGRQTKLARMALSQLAAYLGGQRQWPRKFLPRWIRAEIILDNLAPEWQYLLKNLNATFDRQGVTYQIRLRWMRALTCFVWHQDIPKEAEIDFNVLENQWNKYLESRPALLGCLIQPAIRASLRRGFEGFGNALINAWRVRGPRREFALVEAGYWRPLNRAIRPAAHRLLPHGPAPDHSRLREPLARYVLVRHLKFDAALPDRSLEVAKDDLDGAADALRKEKFSEMPIAQAMDDARRIIELAKKMNESEATWKH